MNLLVSSPCETEPYNKVIKFSQVLEEAQQSNEYELQQLKTELIERHEKEMQALKADLEKAHSTELDGVRKSATESRPNLAMSLDSLDIQVHEKIKGYSTNLKKNSILQSGFTPQVVALRGDILILLVKKCFGSKELLFDIQPQTLKNPEATKENGSVFPNGTKNIPRMHRVMV